MLADVKERIAAACKKAKREPSEVKLVAVSKNHDIAEIKEKILNQGHRVLGENRIQEWRSKQELENIEWHLIGNLQRNKVKYCLPFHTIHSLNSLRLADELNSFGQKKNHIFRVLIEVNTSNEPAKQGIAIDKLEELHDYCQKLEYLDLDGLMTMAPYGTDPEQARAYFVKLRELRDRLGLGNLSMGMSGDFEVAIEEGATIVRVGTAVFR